MWQTLYKGEFPLSASGFALSELTNENILFYCTICRRRP